MTTLASGYSARYDRSVNEVLELRKKAGLTQAALAAASGVSQPNISAYEAGSRRPSKTTLERIKAAAPPRPSTVLAEHLDEVRAVVRRNKGERPRVFGSVARGEDRSGSDIDILVKLRDRASLLDLAQMQEELQDLLGVHVDVVSERGITRRAEGTLKDAVAL